MAKCWMRVVARDLAARGPSAPIEHAEDYDTTLYPAVMGAALATDYRIST